MIEWINFAIYIVSMIIWSWLYLESLQPKKKSKKLGEKAWKLCEQIRIAMGIIEFIPVVNYILTIWYPIPWDRRIAENYWISFTIGVIIAALFTPIMIKGMIDAGKETMSPGEAKEIHNHGLYRYIRHPQTLGEFPLFVSLAFVANSWILFGISVAYIIVYTPIMIKIEERDLILRFGNSYQEYQKNTGALFPKIRRAQ
jgi:protein-S-isoprenylcysteine O-methyltransferase Ste14